MKKAISKFILSKYFQISPLVRPLRSFIRSTSALYDYSPNFLVDTQSTDRPHYAWCMLRAAELAKRLRIERISGIEFGVAGGNGLLFMKNFAQVLERRIGIKIDCYGFDTGEGMPEPTGVADLPYWFQAAQYKMDQDLLRKRLGGAEIVIGNIVDTVKTFLDRYDPAPIAFVFNDTDYYSSTLASLELYTYADVRPKNFMPRIFQYYDDIIGGSWEMYGEFNGQLAAIREFNLAHNNIKIHLNQNLIADIEKSWRFQIYYTHLFDHPLYRLYIGGSDQHTLEDALKLK